MKRREMIRLLEAGENPVDVSIKKWKDAKKYLDECSSNTINWGKIKDMIAYSSNCALCYSYDCYECPIFKVTKENACYNTPYINVLYALDENDFDRLYNAVVDEIKFLESLKGD